MLDMFFCTDLQYDVELYDAGYIDVATQLTLTCSKSTIERMFLLLT